MKSKNLCKKTSQNGFLFWKLRFAGFYTNIRTWPLRTFPHVEKRNLPNV